MGKANARRRPGALSFRSHGLASLCFRCAWAAARTVRPFLISQCFLIYAPIPHGRFTCLLGASHAVQIGPTLFAYQLDDRRLAQTIHHLLRQL